MNEEKFTGKAELYARYRPSYPDSLIDWLYDNAHTDAVADIGAGTGLFTACLLKKPWSVTAVEPNRDMLEKLKGLEKTAGGRLKTVCAASENTGLPDKSAGLVTAAQAFHWFDRVRFRAECMRILRDGGMLGVVWNDITENGIGHERDVLCARYCEAYKNGHVDTGYTDFTGNHSGEFLKNEYFSEMRYFETLYYVEMSRERFLGETLSFSYAPAVEDKAYEPFCEALNELFDRYEKNDRVTVEYKSNCYLGKLK